MSDLNQWLKQHLCALNLTESMDKEDGFTRLSFSKEEKLAHEQFRQISANLGLKTWQDEVGNQWAIWEMDPDAPTIGMGSHLDTVNEGGGYDGVAGVLCALAAIRELKEKEFKPKKNIAVICFISEESARFGVSTIGSKAIVGEMNKRELELIKDQDNITIRQAMEDYGLVWDEIDKAYCVNDRFESFVELHIEQGNQLNRQQRDIGIVHGIATPIRLQITVQGYANHTGTTAMDDRKDALVAISPLISFVNKEAKKVNEHAKDPLAATVSRLNVKPNAMNVIPETVELGIDIRSVDDDLKRDFAKKIEAYCEEIEADDRVEIDIDVLVDEDSVLMDETIQEKLIHVCEKLELAYDRMNSGAGHDIMNVAKRWAAALVFVPSVDGISHNPKEYTPLRYLELGTYLLATHLEFETGGCVE